MESIAKMGTAFLEIYTMLPYGIRAIIDISISTLIMVVVIQTINTIRS